MRPDSLRYSLKLARDNLRDVPWGGHTTQYCGLSCKELPPATRNPGLAVAGEKIVNNELTHVHTHHDRAIKLADPDEGTALQALRDQHYENA